MVSAWASPAKSVPVGIDIQAVPVGRDGINPIHQAATAIESRE